MILSQPPSLPGFTLVEGPGALILARPEAAHWVHDALEEGRTLYEAGRRDAGPELPGRRPVLVIRQKGRQGDRGEEGGFGEGAGAIGHWAVRHYSRGGWALPHLLGDRFLRRGTPRPFLEARTSEEALSRGVPTPRVVAAAFYSHGSFYRADLITEFVHPSSNLLQTVFDTRRKGAGGASERVEALRAAGRLIAQLGRAGLAHGDLNGGNILLHWEGSLPRSLVLDLDRARILPPGAPASTHPMIRRLRRSLRKWAKKTGLTLTEREWMSLDEGVSG